MVNLILMSDFDDNWSAMKLIEAYNLANLFEIWLIRYIFEVLKFWSANTWEFWNLLTEALKFWSIFKPKCMIFKAKKFLKLFGRLCLRYALKVVSMIWWFASFQRKTEESDQLSIQTFVTTLNRQWWLL